MNRAADIGIYSILFSLILVLISLVFSYWQKLGLEKDILISMARAVVQLIIVGYILNYIFGLKNVFFTTFLLVFMILNASYNAAKRGGKIRNIFIISFLSITLGTLVTLIILIFSGIIKYEPYQIIPIGGMIISNSMISLGLSFKQIKLNFKDKRDEIETKLALGATIYQSCSNIVKDSIKVGMIPTIDSAKTLGVVALPGMMTGLILAGTSPVSAVKYQIIVTFMMLSATSITSFTAGYLSYKKFFNDRKQLINK
ncbi:ABC transporter permease [Clostridium tyrobutyricum]|uniref:ABC transporter permease n=1 Tax=Clostridium tyrobutyricum TaxID=1519 RepID=UPI0011C89FCE|nr:iron export ABC transporter permease subunit FetB [Clostridium tyrobutyricum]MBV4416169.1 iron export ABC transporter permease subunit FetB [Clostridium tyrobutyricum]MBV4416230.1 iron export ABC transporter permease subunit FetB [Clostridium tyrobutyricum]MBV4437557.1 iron export ABC transporter permease subunit FetB [Clostridium tyrobutyricum]MEA5008056.1 iron export ABC transporter permease subunit FetB [Clostridium tyrobutyricum]